MNLSKLDKIIVMKNISPVLVANKKLDLFILDIKIKPIRTKIKLNLPMDSWRFLKGYRDRPIIEEVLLIVFNIHELILFSSKFILYKLLIPEDQFVFFNPLLISIKLPGFESEANKIQNL